MSKVTEGAMRRGRAAFKKRIPKKDCPYKDTRNSLGRVTFARACRKAWIEGWDIERDLKKASKK